MFEMHVKEGDVIPLTAVVQNGATDKYITARLWDGPTEITVSPLVLTHISNGRYINYSYAMPNHDVDAVFSVFESDQTTPNQDGAARAEARFELDTRAEKSDLSAVIDAIDGFNTALQPADVVGEVENDSDLGVLIGDTETISGEVGASDSIIEGNVSDSDAIIGEAEPDSDLEGETSE